MTDLATTRPTPPRTLIAVPHLLDVETGAWLDDRRLLLAGDRIEAVLGPGDPAPADARPLAIAGDRPLREGGR